MNTIQEDFLDILEKQRGLVALSIKVTQIGSNEVFDREGEIIESESSYWDHSEPITLKQHGEWSRLDEDYQSRLSFIDMLNLDYYERDIMRQCSTNPALAGNVSKTKLSGRGYSNDNSGEINVGDVYVGFGSASGEMDKKEDTIDLLMKHVPLTEELR